MVLQTKGIIIYLTVLLIVSQFYLTPEAFVGSIPRRAASRRRTTSALPRNKRELKYEIQNEQKDVKRPIWILQSWLWIQILNQIIN